MFDTDVAKLYVLFMNIKVFVDESGIIEKTVGKGEHGKGST